jgi:hypothetical protein
MSGVHPVLKRGSDRRLLDREDDDRRSSPEPILRFRRSQAGQSGEPLATVIASESVPEFPRASVAVTVRT